MVASKSMGAYGHPLVWQSMLSLCCLCTGGMQMYGGMWTPPLSDKVSFLCVVYVQGASRHHPNIWGHPNILVFPLKLTHTCQDWFPPFAQTKPSLNHSDSTWWWQPSWILPCWIQILPSWIQTPCYLLSDSLKNTLPPLWLWLKLIQSDSNSFILTQLDDGSHFEFCHFEFCHLEISHLSFSSQTHSHLPRLVPTICTKKT